MDRGTKNSSNYDLNPYGNASALPSAIEGSIEGEGEHSPTVSDSVVGKSIPVASVKVEAPGE